MSQRRGEPMATYDYDLFVIGGGSGGVRAARVAAGEAGAKVETVNFHVAARLRAVTSRDAPINAIVLLDNLSKNMAIAIEDQLEGIRLIWDHEA